VLAWAKRDFTIDRKRVFATGHSNGGWFTYVLWAARPDEFAAFAPAAAVFGPMADGAKPKPALVIAGQKDQLVPFALQRRTIDAVLRLDSAAAKGEPWFGGAMLHRSNVADVVTWVYPGAHPLPANAAAVVTRFFQRF
jgi:polyhydroxybutyrate depolymerase